MMTSTEPFALAVDDDPVIAFHVADILSDAGFRPLEATNGNEAMGVLEAQGDEITLLFTDVEMPGSMDGFALARLVAARWPEIEIVVCSGRMTPADGDMPPKAIFIGKPFSPQMVQAHLREKLPDGKALVRRVN